MKPYQDLTMLPIIVPHHDGLSLCHLMLSFSNYCSSWIPFSLRPSRTPHRRSLLSNSKFLFLKSRAQHSPYLISSRSSSHSSSCSKLPYTRVCNCSISVTQNWRSCYFSPLPISGFRFMKNIYQTHCKSLIVSGFWSSFSNTFLDDLRPLIDTVFGCCCATLL